MNDGTPIIVRKKKVRAHSVSHGGSWKVAYADFVTAMMAFFLVMWIMGLSDETKALIQGYFNDPLGFTKNEPRAKVNIASFHSNPPRTTAPAGARSGDVSKAIKEDRDKIRDLSQQIAKSLHDGGPDMKKLLEHLEVAVTDEGLRIEFLEASGAVFFDTGQATIRPEARKLVAHIAPLIVQSGRGIVIEGHTDAAPYSGSGEYDNWDLSTDRAASMRRLLKSLGVPGKQFRQVRGYADTQLRKPEDPFDVSNRRVTVLLPFNSADHSAIGMPKEDLKREIQGVFRRPVDVAPDPPPIRG